MAAACIVDHVEMRMREQLALGVPAIKEQDDQALRKARHDFIEELAGKSQLRILIVAHDVANRDCDIADLLFASRLMQDGHARRQVDEGMSIEIGPAIVLGVVKEEKSPRAC